MDIIPANQIKCTNNREEIVNAFCDNLMNRIQKYASEGRHDCCFDATAYYHIPSGKVFGTHNKNWECGDWDSYKYLFDDYANEIRAKFTQAGYVIKPTGYIGGVWQLTEDICW
jgi:hypothetical protein